MGAPQERRNVPYEVFVSVRNRFSAAFVPLSVRERYSLLRARGVPLFMAVRIDCTGDPVHAAGQTVRDIQDFTEWGVIESLSNGNRIDLSDEPRQRSDSDSPFERRLRVADRLAPHFLCSTEERAGLFSDALPDAPPGLLNSTDISGTPFMAAFRVVVAAEQYAGATEALGEALDRLEQEPRG